jgi:hypothetical protein
MHCQAVKQLANSVGRGVNLGAHASRYINHEILWLRKLIADGILHHSAVFQVCEILCAAVPFPPHATARDARDV